MLHPENWCREHLDLTQRCGCTVWPFHTCALCKVIVSENDVMKHLVDCVKKFSKLPADEIINNFEYRTYALFAFIINRCKFDKRIDVNSYLNKYIVFEMYNHFFNDLSKNQMIIFRSEMDDFLYNVFKIVVKEPYTRLLNIVPGIYFDDIHDFRSPEVRLIELFSRRCVNLRNDLKRLRLRSGII